MVTFCYPNFSISFSIKIFSLLTAVILRNYLTKHSYFWLIMSLSWAIFWPKSGCPFVILYFWLPVRYIFSRSSSVRVSSSFRISLLARVSEILGLISGSCCHILSFFFNSHSMRMSFSFLELSLDFCCGLI